MNTVKVFTLVVILLVGLFNACPVHGEDTTSMKVVKVVVGKEVLDLLSRWDAEAKGVLSVPTTRPRISWPICFYTSAANPIASLEGLTPEDVRCWGGELMDHYIDFMAAAGIRNQDGGKVGYANVTGVGNRVFTQDYLKNFPGKKTPKLFFTNCEFQDARNSEGKLCLEDAARVEFVPASHK
jgi:hypothetical protein